MNCAHRCIIIIDTLLKIAYGVGMIKTPKEERLQIRVTGDLKLRLQQLMKKKGLTKTGIVNVAIAEMYDREIGEKKKGGS